MDALLGVLQHHDAAPGEALVAEGTPSDELFLVLDGSLDITMGPPGEERHLAKVVPGSLFGEVSLFDPGRAGASVVTDEGCATLRLNRGAFDELRASSPKAAAALVGEALRSLSGRMQAATARLGGGS